MQIAFKLADILQEQQRSLYSLSQETGINYTTLWTAVRGRHGITYKNLALICVALKVTPGDVLQLVDGEPDAQAEEPTQEGKKKHKKRKK